MSMPMGHGRVEFDCEETSVPLSAQHFFFPPCRVLIVFRFDRITRQKSWVAMRIKKDKSCENVQNEIGILTKPHAV